MNKKGLVGGTLGIVLAVIAIALLLILLVRLSGIFIDNNRIEQAKGVLNELEGAVKNYDSLRNHEVIILNPKDWYLFSVASSEIAIDDDWPPCNPGKNCLCICKYDSKEKCASKSVCNPIKFDASVSVPEMVEFDEILSVEVVKKSDKVFEIARK